MDEREFNRQADVMLAHIEQLLEACPADLDFETLPGGMIELSFEAAGGSKIVINRHAAAREIWLAAKSGGFHFRPQEGASLCWLGTRDGLDLLEVLARCIREQSGESVSF